MFISISIRNRLTTKQSEISSKWLFTQNLYSKLRYKLYSILYSKYFCCRLQLEGGIKIPVLNIWLFQMWAKIAFKYFPAFLPYSLKFRSNYMIFSGPFQAKWGQMRFYVEISFQFWIDTLSRICKLEKYPIKFLKFQNSFDFVFELFCW